MGGLERVDVHNEGVTALLKDPKVAADLMRRGRSIASAAGEGFVVVADPTARRARVVVITATFAARLAEARDRRLSRALDAGR